jgi:transposase
MRCTSYSTDLTDAPWRTIARWVLATKPASRPADYSRREVMDAIVFLTRNGCTWVSAHRKHF